MSEDIFKKIKILKEDKDFIAIFKPKNLLVHGDGKSKGLFLTDWILEKFPEIEGVGEDIVSNENKIIKRPGIVHRLDKDTSGVLLIAKNQDFFEFLKAQFKDRKIEKTYKAFVYGHCKYDEKTIDTPIGRSKTDFRRWATNREIRGVEREAVTSYKVLSKNEKFSFLEVKPKTGRTHQIRVHLKYDNHPIVADNLYAGKNFDRERPLDNLFFTTQALHAHKINFFKADGEKIEVEAPLDESFQKALELIEKS